MAGASPATEVASWYLDQVTLFVEQVNTLHQVAEEHADTPPNAALQQALLDTRIAYKRIEFLVEQLYPDHAKLYFNGAPLPHPVPDSSLEQAPRLLPPEGLQVLDELIFNSAEVSALKDIRRHTAQLLQRARDFQALQDEEVQGRLSHRIAFEACRFSVLRIFALGMTGFDTAGSGNALPEALTSLRAMAEMLEIYEDVLEAEAPALIARLWKTLAEAEGYLATHQDFDRFDRMVWLQQYTRPLYADWLQAQLALDIPTMYEVYPKVDKWKFPVNYRSEDIFHTDFFYRGSFVGHYHAQDQQARIQLGKLLFFDPILSDNQQRSCASCHDPQKAFTDGRAQSLGTDYLSQTGRNAPTLINGAFSHRFFHDFRVHNLEDQIDHVVFNPLEFGTNYEAMVGRIFQSQTYQKLFAAAFPEMYHTQRESGYIVKMALASYVASLVSFDSPFDRYVRGEEAELDEAAIRGFNLFMGKAACGTCHFAPSFGGIVPPYYRESESEVLGVPATPDFENPQADLDPGRLQSGWPLDTNAWYRAHFKTPTVRNVSLTAPYMHNGIYATLEEVMRFYHMGGGQGLGLEIPNQTLPADSLSLSPQDLTDIIAFMESLTDTTGLTSIPQQLPMFPPETGWNSRPIGGSY